MSDSKYFAATVTVPERSEVIIPVVREFAKYHIPHRLYMDTKHKGNMWNTTRMFMELCLSDEFDDKHIITTTDDIFFCDGWFDKVEYVMNHTDYDIVTLFTNLKYQPDDGFIKKACQNWWFYDVCVVFRKGVLNRDFFADFMNHCNPDNLHKFEKNHFDQRISRYTYTNGYKCGIIRPNMVKLQDVKSTLGHKIKDCNN